MPNKDNLQSKPSESRLSPVAKILFLDGVRGTAVIFVVTQHTGYMHDIFMGAVGVDAFFVLSSFLLTMIFMKKSTKLFAENASYRKWGYTLADYFSKRFFRVYPLFALLSIALWLMPFEYKQRYYLVKQPEDFNLFQTLTFHPEHRHYLMWTLPLEISYYFILPAFVLAVLKLGRFWWLSFVPFRLASYEHEKIVEQSGTDSGASESGTTASTPEQKEKLSSTN
ncbi:hypothetical protein JG688_00005117 [Phytophthora aleatoria]|uniref:Acyltransferase 3 domain-containing protein n=1 Tax=Phytophthora aleatoria TaxID=2496075 RepID=A0A8J5IQ62_9STRA|nr:hypothetical protein JG688_00005117 [Phytophthora aleatoria]